MKFTRRTWLTKNRQELLEHSLPIFNDLRSKYNVTHFYFHNIDKTCFLRVHNPDRFGDTIKRHTLAKSAELQKEFYGIELGPYGTLTLRAVIPWKVKEKIVGYIELGEETEYISKQISSILNDDIVITIPKSLLDRIKWEEGLSMLNRSGNWEQFSDFVITDQTQDKIPFEIMDNILKKYPDKNKCLNISEITSPSGSRYLYSCFMFKDIAGKNIAQFIVFKNITKDIYF